MGDSSSLAESPTQPNYNLSLSALTRDCANADMPLTHSLSSEINISLSEAVVLKQTIGNI